MGSVWILPSCRLCGAKLLRWSWYENPAEIVIYGYCLECDLAGREPCIQVLDKKDCTRIS